MIALKYINEIKTYKTKANGMKGRAVKTHAIPLIRNIDSNRTDNCRLYFRSELLNAKNLKGDTIKSPKMTGTNNHKA